MPKRDLLQYWPREEDVRACVKTDAEASSEAVSLAVHQPMRFERRIIGAETPTECDEQELLRAFLSDNLPEGRVIMPIVGSSGVGKSHVVRWLDTQIRRLPNADRRVVIRIPKGTSLRGVLDILLARLQGPAYDEHRRELSRAQQELDPKEAAGLLCEMLAHTLTEMAEEACARLIDKPSDPEFKERAAYCRSDMLPALLRNQFLREHHFVKMEDGSDGVVKRLVAQLTEGRAAGADDDRQHAFAPDDLLFAAINSDELGRAEVRALAQFAREDRRIVAARILNAALDDAKQRLLRLDPTVSDLFDRVRADLLNDGKELVLLVEDFAILSGLQKQLLQIIIKEAIRDGRPVLCTMRTALAYTTGYPIPDTVLTRAHVEYRIPDVPGSDEEILGRIRRLAAAYLNAARLGQGELEAKFEGRETANSVAESWVPTFQTTVEPEARATLDAFGVSADGYELFPFNESAIDELAREGCLRNDQLVYNPRYVIQSVLNKVLIHRDLFEQSAFPPRGFAVRPLPSKVREDVRRRVPDAELERYIAFLAYWGGFPTTLEDIVISERVLAAFGLNGALLGRKPAKSTRAIPVSAPIATPADPTPQPRRESTSNPLEADWEQILERWRRGVPIPQHSALQLRKWIAEALKGAIDWGWVLFRPMDHVSRGSATRRDDWLEQWAFFVYIPSAGGHAGRSAAESMIAVCADEELLDEAQSARIQATLMSLVRFHGVHKGSTWDYDGAEDDLSLYASFLDMHAARARAFVRERYFRAAWNPVPTLVAALLIGARAIGVAGADKDADQSALLDAIFALIPNGALPRVDDDGTGWQEWIAALANCRRTQEKESRDQLSWTGHLLNLVGARQGAGELVYAVDVLALKPAIEETLAHWSFTGSLPNPNGVTEFSRLKAAFAELKRLSPSIAKARERFVMWRKSVIAWIGEDVDKETLVRELKETVEVAKASSGLAHEVDTKKLVAAIEEFRQAKVRVALDDTGKLDQSADRGTTLSVLGHAHESVARVCEELQARYEEFLTSVDADLRNAATVYGDDPMAAAFSDLTAELLAVEQCLREMQK